VVYPDEPVTGYTQLADLLRTQIAEGTYRPGVQLPSETTLRQTYGLGRDSVRNAMRLLACEGLVVIRHGQPTIVRPELDKEPLEPEPGSTVDIRMPSPAERRRLGIAGEGVPVFWVVAPDGTGELYPGDRYRLVWPT
jgi:GntR family transcriptional regulator